MPYSGHEVYSGLIVLYLSSLSLSLSCQLFVTPCTVTHQAPLSVEFSRKNTGECCHFLLQGRICIGRQILYHCATWEALITLYCIHRKKISFSRLFCLFRMIIVYLIPCWVVRVYNPLTYPDSVQIILYHADTSKKAMHPCSHGPPGAGATLQCTRLLKWA